MRRAPWPVAALLGVALAVVITLAGPLLLFNPWFTSALQARHHVATLLETDQADVDRVTGEVLLDLYVGGDFDARLTADQPILDDRERSHMGDVSTLVRLLAAVLVVAVLTAMACAVALRGQSATIGRAMVAAAAGVGLAAALLAVVFAVAFEQAFLAFHAIFFPPGTYLFAPGSRLILLFPEGFWFDASLAAGATIVLTAVAIGLGGWRLLRRSAIG
jgi:integral membrane protein (TIGR01906 family)